MKFYTMELDQLSEEKNDQVYIMPFQQSDIELHDHIFWSLRMSRAEMQYKI